MELGLEVVLPISLKAREIMVTRGHPPFSSRTCACLVAYLVAFSSLIQAAKNLVYAEQFNEVSLPGLLEFQYPYSTRIWIVNLSSSLVSRDILSLWSGLWVHAKPTSVFYLLSNAALTASEPRAQTIFHIVMVLVLINISL